VRQATAPSWLPGATRWLVQVLGKAKGGVVLCQWLEGPLAGREARLDVKSLRREA
jgi:hypothetical protein